MWVMAVLTSSSVLQLMLWGTVLLFMLAVAFFIVRSLRDSTAGDKQTPVDMLANFQEMKLQGEINEKEYRTIQSLLKTPAAEKEKQSPDNA